MVDDETTLIAEEKMERDILYKQELALLEDIFYKSYNL